MPIGGISNLPQVITLPQRGAAANRGTDPVAERQQPPRDSVDTVGRTGERGGGERESIPFFRQQVPASTPVAETPSGRRADEPGLSYTAQRALRAFSDNTPSPGQQLGIELAGVDTFA